MKINNNFEKKPNNNSKDNNLIKNNNNFKKTKLSKKKISFKTKLFWKKQKSKQKTPFDNVFFPKFNPFKDKNPFKKDDVSKTNKASKVENAEKTEIIKKRYFGLTLKIALSLNNVFVTLVRRVSGKVLFSKHSGMIGYKGSKKKNPYVAGEVVKNLLTDLEKLNIQARQTHVQLFFHQKSPYAYSVMRQIRVRKLHVSSVSIVRSVEHSLGLRKPKQRRV